MRNRSKKGWDVWRAWLLNAPSVFILGLVLITAPASAQIKPQESNPKAVKNTLMIVGDSLSAEYGIARGSGWVALLEQKIQSQSLPAKVINASISGDTSSGGLSRLPALLKLHQPTLVVIELGGNDALRGFALDQTERNLKSMIDLAEKNHAKVLLLGMKIPPNFGLRYGSDFIKMYERIAKTKNVSLVPFLLEKVETFQPDGIHPTAAAQPIMLNNVWPTLSKLIR
jgi:acyl-CoA thioesterase I